VEESGKLEKVLLRSRFETTFAFLFPSKLANKKIASNQNQEILLIDSFAPTVFWPRDTCLITRFLNFEKNDQKGTFRPFRAEIAVFG
jgi:hypothetical protein